MYHLPTGLSRLIILIPFDVGVGIEKVSDDGVLFSGRYQY